MLYKYSLYNTTVCILLCVGILNKRHGPLSLINYLPVFVGIIIVQWDLPHGYYIIIVAASVVGSVLLYYCTVRIIF